MTVNFKALVASVFALVCFSFPALAQQPVAPCVTIANQFGVNSCQVVTPTFPLPVTGGGGSASSPSTVTPSALTPVAGRQTIATATLAAATALTVPATATSATINNSGTTNISYTADGTTTPTSTVGEILTPGSTITIVSSPTILAAYKFIRVSAGAQLDVDYYKCTVGGC